MKTLTTRKTSTTATPANRSYVKEKSFKSMSAPERRVAIAKDVIAGLRAKRLVAQSGVYFSPLINADKAKKFDLATDNWGNKQNFQEELDMQQIFKFSMKSCECCAKGALFIAAVEKFDSVKDTNSVNAEDAADRWNGDWVCSPLIEKGFFSRSQLDLIENFFEGFDMYFKGTPIEKANQAFHDIYPKAEDRMIQIMKNIIKNEGTFKPLKLV
jgi:hypothetical protein